ncbi:MAG: pilus assembly protein PilQ [Sorangiineae bacterium NIC37A_2]|jgi:type IV pilus assembly protein PilQ|nr:MAG: pilus assembly protein PilQ [Sorangiineae bacterium NIC37A_2]
MRLTPRAFRPIFVRALVAMALTGVPAQAAPVGTVEAVTVEEGASKLGVVQIELDGPPTYSARLDKAARRLIVELSGVRVGKFEPAWTDARGVIGGVLSQTFEGETGPLTRVTISLTRDASYSFAVEENRLLVSFSEGALGVSDSRLPTVETKVRPSEQASEGAVVSRLLDVNFSHSPYRDVVELELDTRTNFRVDNGTSGRSTLILRGAVVPPALVRTLDVDAFGGLVHKISSFADGQDVVIHVQREAAATSSVERQGNRLLWSFYKPGTLPSSLTGVARDGREARKSKTVTTEHTKVDLPVVRTAEEVMASGVATSEEASAFGPVALGQADNAAGRRIDLDLKDADIHNVLRLIGDVARRNIVVADEVKGRVTIRLRNVPWDQALGVILQAKKLGMVEQGNMIRVAPLDQLQKERELEMERRKMAVQLAPIETRLMPISYAQASDVAQRVTVLLSSRGTIAVDDRTNTLIVRDVSGALDQVEELTRALDTQTPQVLVEARIVEATSTYLKDIGIQWGGSGAMSAATGNPTGLVFPNSIGVVGGASDANTPTQGMSPFTPTVPNPNFAVNLPATAGTGRGGALGLTFGSIDNNVNLAVRLSAAESSGMLRILSSPRVLTLDNLEAKISQGTLIPFSQVSAQGVQTVFQEAKLQLLVRPHVTADGSVQMRVKINRDEPDFNQTSARGDPTILKREAQTELLVMDGHTAVIGGIFTRNTGRNLDQVPFFGDIPVLGVLFQRRRSSDTRGELVIFITPRIVNRAEALGR